MKENKNKPKKISNKQAKKNAETDLEIKIIEKFTDVIKDLGYNPDKITKEIKKACKQFSKKLLGKQNGLIDLMEGKIATPKSKVSKSAIIGEEKAKKIVIEATRKHPKGEKIIPNAQKHIIPEFSLPVIIDSKETDGINPSVSNPKMDDPENHE